MTLIFHTTRKAQSLFASILLSCFLLWCLVLFTHCAPVQRASESSIPTNQEGEPVSPEIQQQQAPSRTPEEQLEYFNLFLDIG